MALEAKMLMQKTIQPETVISPPLGLIQTNQSLKYTRLLAFKDYMLFYICSTQSLAISVHPKLNNSIDNGKIINIPTTMNENGTSFNMKFNYNDYADNTKYHCPIIPIGNNNQFIIIYENKVTNSSSNTYTNNYSFLVVCYRINANEFIKQSSQVISLPSMSYTPYTSGSYTYGGVSRTLHYSVYNNSILLNTMSISRSNDVNNYNTSKTTWREKGYMGKVTEEGLVLEEILDFSHGPVAKSSDQYMNGYYGESYCVLYSDNEGYMGCCIPYIGLYLLYSGMWYKINLENKTKTSCGTNILVKIENISTVPVTLRTDSYSTIRTTNYTLVRYCKESSVDYDNWFLIDKLGNISITNIKDSTIYNYAEYSNRIITNEILDETYGFAGHIAYETENGIEFKSQIKDIDYNLYLLSNSFLTARTLLGIYRNYAFLIENRFTGNYNYRLLTAPIDVDRHNYLVYNTSSNKNVKYICKQNKDTQIVSIMFTPTDETIENTILLYAGGNIVTKFVFTGTQQFTYANCPLVFSSGTELEFRAIKNVDSVSITMFGIEEDV